MYPKIFKSVNEQGTSYINKNEKIYTLLIIIVCGTLMLSIPVIDFFYQDRYKSELFILLVTLQFVILKSYLKKIYLVTINKEMYLGSLSLLSILIITLYSVLINYETNQFLWFIIINFTIMEVIFSLLISRRNLYETIVLNLGLNLFVFAIIYNEYKTLIPILIASFYFFRSSIGDLIKKSMIIIREK